LVLEKTGCYIGKLLDASCLSFKQPAASLYTKYISPEQAQVISQALREENYQVKVNDLPFPDSARINTLAYVALANENHRGPELSIFNLIV